MSRWLSSTLDYLCPLQCVTALSSSKHSLQFHSCVQVDAEASFKQVKVAYETLADDDKRREYDITAGTRRMGFFRDVDFEAEEQQSWGRPADPFDIHRYAGSSSTIC